MWRRISFFPAVIEELGLLFGIGILLTAAVLFVLMIRLGGWSCRRILQKSCSRICNFIPVSDVSDCRRRKQIYPADRCDASSCQLRWKQRDDDDPDVWRHRRRFCLAV